MPGFNTHTQFHGNIPDGNRTIMRKNGIQKMNWTSWCQKHSLHRWGIAPHRQCPASHNAAAKFIIQCRAPSYQFVFYRVFQKAAAGARISSICSRLMCLCGGISKARSSRIPSQPDDESGEYNLSMQNSERWVLPVISVSRWRKMRSVIQKGIKPLSGTWLKAISISYKLSSSPSSIRGAWLVGPTKEPENKYDNPGMMLPERNKGFAVNQGAA